MDDPMVKGSWNTSREIKIECSREKKVIYLFLKAA
jgi:hypothetical protein